MTALLRQSVLAGIVAVMFSSCATRPPAISPSRLSPETLVRSIREHGDRLSTLRGSGSLSFESPEMSGTASFDVTIKRPDSLLAKFEGPFGIDLGTLFLCPQFFEMYNAMQNHITSGVPDARTFRSFLPFELSYQQILDAFAGSFMPPNDMTPIRSSESDGAIALLYSCGSDTCEYWIDPDETTVTAFRRRDVKGNIAMESECSSFVEKNGALVPRHITVRFPGQRRQLNIHYTSLSINPPEPSFAYTLPRTAQRSTR